MTQTIASILAVGLLLLSAQTAEAGRFDGWCFMEDECTGPSKIADDTFVTCEENCRLTEPTKVDGLDGTLYWVECRGDNGSKKERMLLLRYKDNDGKARALAVTDYGSQELEQCTN